MADGVEGGGCGGGAAAGDFYSVLGLDKECSSVELKTAYKKLAMKWHPDRCSASGSVQVTDHAKEKFQEIQEAYSVLSDCNKRLMYDVGFYDSDDDENGMGDFLGEMAAMMNEHKPDPVCKNKNAQDSFQDLQDLFMEMFNAEDGMSSSTNAAATSASRSTNKPPLRTTSLPADLASMPAGGSTLKRDCANMASGAGRTRTASVVSSFADPFSSASSGAFCFGSSSGASGGSGRFSAPSPRGADGSGNPPGMPLGGSTKVGRNGRKQKMSSSSRHEVSSWDSGGVSAS